MPRPLLPQVPREGGTGWKEWIPQTGHWDPQQFWKTIPVSEREEMGGGGEERRGGRGEEGGESKVVGGKREGEGEEERRERRGR